MKLFISWSGDASKAAAELFKDWLPYVIQEADVWVSSQDIAKGERWSAAIWENLAEIDFGLLMVTKANAEAPWLMFEAGALSKSIKSKVIPILCDVDRLQLAKTPLTQFQDAQITKDDIFGVVVAINAVCTVPLESSRLRAIFDKWWPDFEGAYKGINFGAPKSAKKAADNDSERLDRIEAGLEGVIKSLNAINLDRTSDHNMARLFREAPTWADYERVRFRDKEYDQLRRLQERERVRLSDLAKADADIPADKSS